MEILNQMVGGCRVTQEVLPKQAPEAVETNGRETTLKRKRKLNKKQRQSSAAVIQRSSAMPVYEGQGIFFSHTLKTTQTHM